MIDKIAEFCGLIYRDYGCCDPYWGAPWGEWRDTSLHAKGTVKEKHIALAYRIDDFRPTEDWNLWMTLVEPRIREQDLWGAYIDQLYNFTTHFDAEELMSATLEQRASALERVLEERE